MKFFVFTILSLCILIFSLSVSCQTNSQSGVRTGLMSDAEADQLKGKVKEVIVENEYLPGYIETQKKRFKVIVDNKREISSITEYDEKGYRIKRDAYSNGRLFLKVVYGFLDGERISKDETVSYGDEIFTAPPAPKSGNRQEKPKDSRYAYKLTYKFNEKGNRIEENWISNTGEIWIKDIIAFDKDNRVIEQTRRHRGEDKISSRVIFKYDDNGNLKQEIYLNASGEESEKHELFEFDLQGNWIKHIVSNQTGYNPKGVFEPFLITYREIKYF